MRVEARYGMVVSVPTSRAGAAFMVPAMAPVGDALEERGGRRRDGGAARRQAAALLDALGAVQLAMLAGDETACLAALEAIAAEPAPPAEPGLAALLSAIRLRARVTALQCRERCRATPWLVSNTPL